MSESMALEDVARRALDGDRNAVEQLVSDLQGDVYGLSLRMLWNREDAEDATQEILVRVITRLARFDFRSKLKTWVYRIAVNYILDVKKSAVERMQLTFEQFADDLADGLSLGGPADVERSLLVEEVKIGCTLGMLQCLDRPHRLAYVLGDILELPGPAAAEVLEITPALFRKRLQQALKQSSRSRACIVVWRQTPPLVPATDGCRRHCAADGSATVHPTLRASPRRTSKRARSFGDSTRRAARLRSTEPAIRERPRSTSPAVLFKYSIRSLAATRTLRQSV